MMSLSDDKQADTIEALNTTSRYLDGILNINNIYFDIMVRKIYPAELQHNKANTCTYDTEAIVFRLAFVHTYYLFLKNYNKSNDFDFENVISPFRW